MNRGIERRGIWSFKDFSAYLNDWIIPNVLPDLETVFEGSRDYWERDISRWPNGRGDFVLATALFAQLDHLGAFLASTESRSLQPRENIARIARQLPSTRQIDHIVAHFGRNPLVHGAWPQTIIIMDNGDWGFGLAIHADPDADKSGDLKKKLHSFPLSNPASREIDVLTLGLNVRKVHTELVRAILSGELFRDVRPPVFARIREIAIAGAVDWSKSLSSLRKGSPETSEPPIAGVERQIRMQLEIAKRKGIW